MASENCCTLSHEPWSWLFMSPNLASNIPGISFFIPFCQKPRVLEWSLKVEPAWLAHRSAWVSRWIIHLIQLEKADSHTVAPRQSPLLAAEKRQIHFCSPVSGTDEKMFSVEGNPAVKILHALSRYGYWKHRKTVKRSNIQNPRPPQHFIRTYCSSYLQSNFTDFTDFTLDQEGWKNSEWLEEESIRVNSNPSADRDSPRA